MRKTTTSLSLKLLLITLLFSFQLAAQPFQNAEKYIQRKVDFYEVAGLAVGLIVGDSVKILTFGVADKTADSPVLPTTLFEIGAASKVFTAALVHTFVAAGKLHYDAPARQYFRRDSTLLRAQTFSVRDLVTHTAGLPKLPYNLYPLPTDANPYRQYTTEALSEFLKMLPPDAPKTYSYSHLHYALLTLLINEIAPIGFEKALDKMLKSNGLHQTTASPAPNLQMAQGYDATGKPTAPWASVGIFQGALGCKTTAADATRWLQLQLFDSAWAQTHRTMAQTPHPKVKAAHGWHEVRIKKIHHPALAHFGQTNGHQAYFGFVRQTQTGVVVLSNTTAGIGGLGEQLLKILNNNSKHN